MHSLLQRQLRRFIGTSDALSPEWRQFVEAVNNAYRSHDEDRFLIERSLELTSKELVEQNARLRGELEERLKAEEQLHLWAKVFESSSEGIFITDAQKKIISVNRAFVEITSFQPIEVLGSYPGILKPGLHDRHYIEGIWKTLESVGHWQGEILDRRKSGEAYPAWAAITADKNSQGAVTNYIAIISDISDRKAAEERIHTLAFYDFLTGLPNRTLLCDRLDLAIAHARRTEKSVAVLFIDLDRFKTINDSLGHHAGDNLLQEVSERIKGCVRQDDTVSRLGGDEFVIVLSDIHDASDAAKVAIKLANILAIPFRINGAELHVTHSTGISIYPHDGEDIDTLLRNADAAMYFAKELGRNNYQFFTADLNARALERLSLETSLRRALERDELILHYQPQVSLTTGRISCMEALVRWQHPELGLVSPGKFIPLAEETGLIVPLGEWVLRTACAQAKAWQKAGLIDINIAVNISARQFKQKDLVERILTILEETGLDPKYLELELTEGLVMQNPEEAIRTINQLKKGGVQFAIDDFGTGYSSLSYLKRFPIDRMKIDRSFVHDISKGSINAAIVTALISLAHGLKLRIVAEGVETAEELAFLCEKGCDEMQGFYFCTPLPEDEALKFLLEGGSLTLADLPCLKRSALK